MMIVTMIVHPCRRNPSSQQDTKKSTQHGALCFPHHVDLNGLLRERHMRPALVLTWRNAEESVLRVV